MTIDYDRLKNRIFPEIRHTYGRKDSILYALSVGLGQDPLDTDQLRFVYERELCALPTMAVVLGYPGFWLKEPDTGLDWKAVLHMDQEIVLHRPLASQASVLGRTQVEEIFDKGAGRGAILRTRRDIVEAETGHAIATVRLHEYCRGEGGFGGPSAPPVVREPPPQGPPDAVVDLSTLPQAALIYRLNGDDNPLHADPAVAAAAGFNRPILHGLCTFGVVGHALLRAACAYDPTRFNAMRLRFTAPVYPGETLRVSLWKNAQDGIRFTADVVERSLRVVDDGTLHHS